MRSFARYVLCLSFLWAAAGAAQADSYSDTIALFKNAGDSSQNQ